MPQGWLQEECNNENRKEQDKVIQDFQMRQKRKKTTLTGWKNSSITFCALESSEDAAEDITLAFEGLLLPASLGAGVCRLTCLLWVPLGDLNNFQVKTIATASPAIAPTDRESCKPITSHIVSIRTFSIL